MLQTTLRFVLIVAGLLLCGLPLALGQSATATPDNWQRYTDKGEEFSVLLPELPSAWEDYERLAPRSLAVPKLLGHYYIAYGDGVIFYVMSYRKGGRINSLNDMASLIKAWHHEDIDKGEQQKAQINGLDIIQISYLDKEVFIAGRFYTAKNHFYYIRVVGEKEQLATMQKFFDSFNLSEKPEGLKIGAGGRLQDEPAGLADIGPTINTPDKTKVETANGDKAMQHTALLCFRPTPPYTGEALRDSIKGTVLLRVLLAASGRATNIQILKKLHSGLDKNAIAAARRIYFLPAKKDGHRVSQWVQLEYSFNIY